MIEINTLDEYRFSPTDNMVIALGFFDGVHRAHQEIIHTCLTRAKERGGKSLLFTFKNHPRTALHPDQPVPLLTPYPLKRQLIMQYELDYLLGIPFDHEFSQITAQDFVQSILQKQLAAQEIVVGYNFHFGYQRQGDADFLRSSAPQWFEAVHVIERQSIDNETISSTFIRNKIAEGTITSIPKLLGRPYQIVGTVVRGDGRGRSIGIPTANLSIDHQVLPPNGVYGVRARIDSVNNPPHWGVMNIGNVPTFKNEKTRSVEVHFLDQEIDLYNQFLIVDVLHSLRPEKKFSTPEELVRQIHHDIHIFKSWLQEQPPSI